MKVTSFKALLLSALLITASGCGVFNVTQKTATTTLNVVSSAVNLSYHYDNGQAVEFLGQAELTDLEATQVLEALDQVSRSKERLKLYKDSPQKLIEDLPKVSFEYAKIKSAYLTVRSIVEKHWDEYDDEAKAVFLEFDGASNVLDEHFSDLHSRVEANAAIMTAIRLGDTVLKAASLL